MSISPLMMTAPRWSLTMRWTKSVDLDDIDGNGEQMGERGIAGAEVVERDAHAGRPQFADLPGDDLVALVEIDAFGYLQGNPAQGDARIGELAGHPFGKARPVEVGGRQVDADPAEIDARIHPASRVGRDIAEHPPCQFEGDMLTSLVASWKCAADRMSPSRVRIRHSASRLATRPVASSTIGW